jgi:hypothetical protein
MTTRGFLITLPAAILVVLFAIGFTSMWLTVPLGLFAAFIAPGVALLDLFAPHQLRGLAGAALAAATSMGSLIVGGLLINLFPWGLTALTWSVGLLVVTGAASIASAVRGWPTDGDERPRARPRPTTVMRGAGCLILATIALTVAVRSQDAANEAQTFTQLWVTPNEGSVQTVHLSNNEGKPITYRVSIQVADLPPTEQVVTIPNASTWTTDVEADRTGQLERLLVRVYRDGAGPDPYREVALNTGELGHPG